VCFATLIPKAAVCVEIRVPEFPLLESQRDVVFFESQINSQNERQASIMRGRFVRILVNLCRPLANFFVLALFLSLAE
jgi:hypothetical protein